MTSLRHNADEGRDPRAGYLDTARACIVDLGWRRTTLTEIARRAGVSRMTLYRACGDMPTLLADLLTREADDLLAAAPADRSLVEQALAIITALRGDRFFASIVARDPDLLLPYLLERRGRAQQHVLDLLVARIRQGQRAGEIRLGDAAAMARAMALTAHGFLLSAQTMTDDQVSEEALVAELGLLLTRMLAP